MNAQLLYAPLAIVAGFCIALQASANTNFKANLGDKPLYATFFSICGTFITIVAAMCILRPSMPDMAGIRQAPWWNWIGGPLGAIFVLAGASLTQHLGAALFVALVIGGQLLCSLSLDHFGLMGLPQQSLTPGRVLGAALVVAGVVCIKYL